MKLRERSEKLLADASARQKMDFYRRVYTAGKAGAAAGLAALALKTGGRGVPAGDLFADYRAGAALSAEELLDVLLSADVISFDIFDTLLLRRVARPVDVFALLEKELAIPGFAGRREEAERSARRRKLEQCGHSEIGLEEIYAQAPLRLELPAEMLMAAELKKEKECCRANPPLLSLTERLLATGKKVVLISDMYLHEREIRALIENCGYAGLENIFVSCDCQAGKYDGRLFRLVWERLGGELQMVHVGDSFHSDLLMAEKAGIKAFHYIREAAE